MVLLKKGQHSNIILRNREICVLWIIFTNQEGVAAVTADDSHPLRLDGQCWLRWLLLWDHHHRAQVDDASAVNNKQTMVMLLSQPKQHFEHLHLYK